MSTRHARPNDRSPLSSTRTLAEMEPEEYKRAALETWSTMAPGWERWREPIEATSVPVREWMLRELAPSEGDTVLELAAGFGDTSHAAAEIVGPDGKVICTDFSPVMVDIARRRGEELGLDERRVPGAGRRADRARGRLRRRRALPLRVHAHAGSPARARGDATRAPSRRASRPRGLARGRAQSVDLDRRPHAPRARPRPSARAGRAGDVHDGTRRARARAARGRRPHRPPARGGAGAVRLREPRRVRSPRAGHGRRSSRGSGARCRTASARRWSRSSASAFAPFAVDGGYEFPGVALCAAAQKG